MAALAIREASPGSVVILGDRYGALTLAAGSLGAREIRSHQDAHGGRMALRANADALADSLELPPNTFVSRELDEGLLAQAEIVLVQLPKDLAQLENWAALVAAHASESVQVFAGGRIKHMTRAMNNVLERYFGRVRASLARQKSRVLLASEPRLGVVLQQGPSEKYDHDLDLWVCSYPGAFAAGRVDHGTRFLTSFIREMPRAEPGGVAADLGCGTGLLSATLVRSHPEYHVIATDRSAAAVRSARATLQRNLPGESTRYEVRQDHALLGQPDASLDLIVCNPPFHAEASISTALSELLFREAARTLRPGGVMLTVFNSHLLHRRVLQRLVGPTAQLGRNQKFTVTRSVRGTGSGQGGVAQRRHPSS